MKGQAHRNVTDKALRLLKMMGDLVLTEPDISYRLTQESSEADSFDDMEWVDVDYGRDNPHADDGVWVDEDHGRYSDLGKRFCGFNHMMDLQKGPGEFDDFDGYSYYRGSAHTGEHQAFTEFLEQEEDWAWLANLMDVVGVSDDIKVDWAISFYFNDEYVHAPSHPWYDHCSPSVENYSFPHDGGRYGSKVDELAARFPLASNVGEVGKGIPYSVFMPVDNMARYWYGRFLETTEPAALGAVLHAIEDASIPHHATGYMGNWHAEWEGQQNKYLMFWLWNSPPFEKKVRSLISEYYRHDPSPPDHLEYQHWSVTPAVNWDIEWLVTWMALNAYRVFSVEMENFENGFVGSPLYFAGGRWTHEQMRSPYARKILRLTMDLTAKVTALCVLVLVKANQESLARIEGHEVTEEYYLEYAGELEKVPFEEYILNMRSGELHTTDCPWISLMAEKNIRRFVSLDEAIRQGYNGCHHCLEEHDTG